MLVRDTRLKLGKNLRESDAMFERGLNPHHQNKYPPCFPKTMGVFDYTTSIITYLVSEKD